MSCPLLVFRVGYMPFYDGVDTITSGGAYIRANGVGGEMWNFHDEAGRCYGYVMTKGFAGIDLRRLDDTVSWEENDEFDGVDVVFIAKKPGVGQVVVGWYNGATVFHKKYRRCSGRKKFGDWDTFDYLCQVDAEHAILLSEDSRTFEVPSASVDGKGFPGQSNVWYPNADIDIPVVSTFIHKLREYINSSSRENRIKNNRGGWVNKPEKDLILKIEEASVAATREYFTKQGYVVVSVEKDNRGWDLEANKGNERLYIEVKGHLGKVVQFELTPNEYSQLQSHAEYYRVCVVRNALIDSDVEVFTPEKTGDSWILNNGKCTIKLREKIAARAFEIERQD